MDEKHSLNLYQKLLAISINVADVIKKDAKAFNYNYADEPTILAKYKAGAKQYGVLLTTSMKPDSLVVTPTKHVEVKKDKEGKVVSEKETEEIMVYGELIYTWTNTDDPDEQIVGSWPFLNKSDSAYQALGGALTYANRYFLMKFLQIATPKDDPDAWRDKVRDAELQEEYAVIDELVSQIGEGITEYLAKYEKDADVKKAREQVAEICKKYARDKGKPSADYRLVNSVKSATALLEEIIKLNGGNA